MIINVSIATVYSEVYFDYFLLFSVFFQNHTFFGDVIVSYMTAGLGFKMAASIPKWRVCDVIVTSRHVLIDTS